MVCGYYRFALAILLPSRSAQDLYAGWRQLISQLGAVPRALMWDGEGRPVASSPELTGECQAFRGTVATKVIFCKPADPEAKSLVKRLHDYLERSFLPGRRFVSPQDFNNQVAGFLARADSRQHRVLGCHPLDRLHAGSNRGGDPVTGRIRHRAGDRYRRRRADGVMAATKSVTANRDLPSKLVFSTRALNAHTLRDSAARLAERARAESWSHEEYLAACLQCKVAARDAHCGEGRIRAARFSARKSIEELDFDHTRGLKRDLIAHLGSLDFVTGKEKRDLPRPTRLTLRAAARSAPRRVGLVFRVFVAKPW